ncbi:MAG: type II toxin-antitoxin system RelE/ParE family toxin [Desulfococcaceae bacterium]
MKPVFLRPGAAKDVQDGWTWYEKERMGLGTEFLRELERMADRISEIPEMYPVFRRGARRATLRRFPYSVICRETADCIWIVAVFHAKRNPAILQKRWETD